MVHLYIRNLRDGLEDGYLVKRFVLLGGYS